MSHLAVPNMDGPSDTRSQGRGSQAGSRSGSHAGSHTGGSQSGRSRSGSTAQKVSAFGPGHGFDPALDNPNESMENVNRRLDLPADAYNRHESSTPFSRRPGFNKTGQDIRVYVNQFRVTKISDYNVQQYDLTISPGGDKRGLIEKVWKSMAVQTALAKNKAPWIFDGNKLVWSTNKISELRITVDLGKEQGKQPGNPKDTFYFIMKHTGNIQTNALRAYLEGKMDWDTAVLECMNFLDHAIRQGPSERMLSFKRTFFPPNSPAELLNNVTEAIKGIYASIRMTQSINQGGLGLGVLVNISHQTFFVAQEFEQFVREFMSTYDKKFANMQYDRLDRELRPVKVTTKDGRQTYGMSDAFKALRRLTRLNFHVYHRGKTEDKKVYKIKTFTWAATQDGANAKTVTFEHKDHKTGQTKAMSVYEYFQMKYNIRLRYWYFPLIETARGGFFPWEVCHLDRYNRYPFKLDPEQTSAMIKFAVQRPTQRKADILQAVNQLNWKADKYLSDLKIAIDPNMTMVQAKLMKNPEVQYANGKADPKMSGRWDLRGKKFVLPNAVPLRSWAFVVTDGCIDKPTLDNFVKVFSQTYQGHGGRIEKPPMVYSFPPKKQHSEIVEEAYLQTGRATKMSPQIIFFVLKDKTSWVYERMKKNTDCRFACLSQMLNSMHVRKAQPQYCSNVCMKVNSKLGGQTSRIPGPTPNVSPFFKVPTMMIGVDLNHGHPGSELASMAAMTVSMDKDAATYVAAVQTNGTRTEILLPDNIHSMLPDIVKNWRTKNGADPQHVFYFRDGVSEGEFAQVVDREVSNIKAVFKGICGKEPKVTAIIATKRHHVRFFPEKGDKNGNPLPGTVVEREVTHPFHYDFYLCSHVAIQGTARPVHYHVIHDEIKLSPDDLQKMIYQQCYQYARSTTPVSLHPAVYYAHLASARARAHENMATSQQMDPDKRHLVLPQPGAMAKWDPSDGPDAATLRRARTEAQPLLPMGGKDARPDAKTVFRNTMWYI